MRLRNKLHTTLLAAISFLLMLVAPGCINDSSQCPEPDNDSGKGVTLRFSMVTRNAAGEKDTRALVMPPSTEIGDAAENYLDLDNLTFLLFDNTPKLLRAFKPDVTVDTRDTYIKYSVEAFLDDSYFLNANSGNLTFTIVVIGNYSSISGADNMNWYVGQPLSEIFDPDKVMTFPMPKSNNWASVWIPSIFGTTITDGFGNEIGGMRKAHIPMAGMQTYTVSVDDLKTSTAERPLNLSKTDAGNLNMLRALAKVEIVDNIGIAGGSIPADADRSYIEKVELVGFTDRGSILPTYSQWTTSGTETQYVTRPSIPSGASYRGATPIDGLNISEANTSKLVNFYSTIRNGARVFGCYLTEYDVAALKGQEEMWIRLTVNDKTATGRQSKFYRINIAPYPDYVQGAGMSVLRNNIYRYTVTGISPTLQLTLTVDPWNLQSVPWDYTDNPGVASGGYLTFTTLGESTQSPGEPKIIYSGTTPVAGRFQLITPSGGQWIASFVRDDEYTANDAFVFTDAAGNEKGSIDSGEITGEPAYIYIKAKNPPTSYNQVARLIFSVYNPADQRTISANLVDQSTYPGKKYFIIQQNAKQ